MFGVGTAFSHVFFRDTPLPASGNFWAKVQLSTKSDAFLSTNILLSLNLFSTYCTVLRKLRYCDMGRVSYKKLNGREFGNWLTANFRFPAVTWKNIVWSFLMPLWCNKYLPGQNASRIIAFEFFWYVCLYAYPIRFLEGKERKVVLVLEILGCTSFSTFKLFSMVKWLR